MSRFIALVGLGFGDEGKGSWTDFFVRQHNAELVIRANGGAQAGHNVVLADGRHHVFSQFGSGTFAGAKTLLSRYMLVNPITMFPEAKHLIEVGISNPWDQMIIERDALITTPFHIAANRLQEMHRNIDRHGSCGLGIGETMSDWLENKDDCLFIRDLEDSCSANCLNKLHAVKGRMLERTVELRKGVDRTDPNMVRELDILEGKNTVREIYNYFEPFRHLVTIVDAHWLSRQTRRYETIVFEGAQGVLLDQHYGFQPYTTWTDCTFGNVNRVLEGISKDVLRLGIIRAYATRHGTGPFVSEDARFIACSHADHNRYNEWQHDFRSGAFDQVATAYAVNAVGGVDGLLMSHLDRLELAEEAEKVPVCVGYADKEIELDLFKRACFKGANGLMSPEELTRRLFATKPKLENVNYEGYAETIAARMDVPLYGVSRGQHAGMKTLCTKD